MNQLDIKDELIKLGKRRQRIEYFRGIFHGVMIAVIVELIVLIVIHTR